MAEPLRRHRSPSRSRRVRPSVVTPQPRGVRARRAGAAGRPRERHDDLLRRERRGRASHGRSPSATRRSGSAPPARSTRVTHPTASAVRRAAAEQVAAARAGLRARPSSLRAGAVGRQRPASPGSGAPHGQRLEDGRPCGAVRRGLGGERGTIVVLPAGRAASPRIQRSSPDRNAIPTEHPSISPLDVELIAQITPR